MILDLHNIEDLPKFHFNANRMLEQTIMFKQLQELQRQKELQETNDARQQNVMNQQSLMHRKQSSGAQYGLLNHGIRVRDPSQMFMFGDKNLVQGSSNQMVSSQYQGRSHESPGLSTTHRSQQVGTFGKSFIADQSKGSSNKALATMDPLEKRIMVKKEEGTESSENWFERTKNSSEFPSVRSGSRSAVMQSAVTEASSSNKFPDTRFENPNTGVYSGMSGFMDKSLGFPAPNLSGNMLGLRHRLEKEHNNLVSISEVPKAEIDYSFSPSYNKSSHSPYFGLRLTPTSQSPHVNYFDQSRSSQQEGHFNKPSQGPQSDNNQLPNQKCTTNHLVSVKIEDGQQWSTRPENNRMESAFEASKYVKKINKPLESNENVSNSQGFEVEKGFPSKKGAIKIEKINYDNNLPQLTTNSSKHKNHEAAKCIVIKKEFESVERNSSLVQDASINQCGTNKVALKSSSSLPLQHLDVANQNTVVSNSKKRKFPAFLHVPWHKEVTEGSSRIHDMSTAELEWAKSAVRLPEKLKELAEGSWWVVQRKRRLNFTTQLMQVLFGPAPAIILSEDAISYYDTVIYYAAKLALGDACSLCSSSEKKSTSKSSIDEDLSKVIEGFIDRSKRLEDEFSRLEKRELSILEVRMGFQDLEKFAAINRFAKFHTRRPLVTSGPSSSHVASSKRKPYPQRYVKASLPKMVPEGQNCLSL